MSSDASSDSSDLEDFEFFIDCIDFIEIAEKITKSSRFGNSNDQIFQMNLILNSNNDFVLNDAIGMTKVSFQILCQLIIERKLITLRRSRKINIEFIVFIGMQWLVKGMSVRTQSVNWKLSYQAIHRCRHLFTNAIISIYNELINWDVPDSKLHGKININNIDHYFSNAIANMDGIHIELIVPSEYANAFRDRKGNTSTNVLAICNYNLLFTYVLVGMEGYLTIYQYIII